MHMTEEQRQELRSLTGKFLVDPRNCRKASGAFQLRFGASARRILFWVLWPTLLYLAVEQLLGQIPGQTEGIVEVVGFKLGKTDERGNPDHILKLSDNPTTFVIGLDTLNTLQALKAVGKRARIEYFGHNVGDSNALVITALYLESNDDGFQLVSSQDAALSWVPRIRDIVVIVAFILFFLLLLYCEVKITRAARRFGGAYYGVFGQDYRRVSEIMQQGRIEPEASATES